MLPPEVPAVDRSSSPAASDMWAERPRRESTSFWAAARRPRMLGLLIVLLLAAAVCARLGVWQLGRAYERGDQAAARQVAARESAAPVPLAAVLAPQTAFPADLVGRQVVATGRWEPTGQLLVAGRALDGQVGYLVLTPLRVDVATGARAVLPVVRGWVAQPGDPAVVAPSGTVTVTGYLQVGEGAGEAGRPGGRDLPEGQTDAISPAALLNRWDGPIWTGYLVLTAPAQQGLAQLPPPTSPGASLNAQNLVYAAQWWIFGGFALALWWRLVRDEATGDPGAGVAPAGPGGGGPPVGRAGQAPPVAPGGGSPPAERGAGAPRARTMASAETGAASVARGEDQS